MRQIRKLSIVLVAALCTLALVGCGKKIPECGDQQVQNLISKISREHFEKMAPTVGSRYLEMANSGSDIPAFTLVGVTPTLNPKLSGFASQKKDKDAGVNFCTAINSSEVLWEVKLKITPLLADNPEIANLYISNAKLVIETDAETKSFGGTVSTENGIVTVNVKTPLSETISYSTQVTDKGDSLLVNLGKEK